MANSYGLGNMRKRSNGTYEYRVYVGVDCDGKPLRKSFYGKTKPDAKESYNKWLAKGNAPIERVTTVNEWAPQWLENYKKGKVADSTYLNYKLYVEKYIVPELGKMKLEQVRPAHIEKFYAKYSDLSFSSRNHINVALKGIFDSAVENKLCDSSPVKPIKRKRDEISKIKVFSPTQLKSLLKTAKAHQYGHYIELLLYTGLRVGELIALKWSDIDDDAIIVQRSYGKKLDGTYADKSTKSGKVRIVAINDELKNTLSNIPRTCEYVISDSGKQLSEHQFSIRYRKVLSDAGIDYLSPHKCRHTYATYLLKGGANIKAAQAMLGHSTLSVTEQYVHVDINDLKSNVAKLNYTKETDTDVDE